MKFRQLEANEIECRVAQIKSNGLSLLLYKDARCDMRILDEVVGAEYWKRDHKEVKGNVYCGVSIYCELDEPVYETLDNDQILIEPAHKEWITKWDAGAESYTEKVKGEASDSFKRACFNWGIGRELYTSPFIWIKPRDGKEIFCTNPDKPQKEHKYKCWTKFNVFDIEYKDDSISYLCITDDSGAVRFTWGKAVSMTQEQRELIFAKEIKQEAKWCEYFKIRTLDELSKKQAQQMIEILKLGVENENNTN